MDKVAVYRSMGPWYVLTVFHVMPLSCATPLIPVTTPGVPGEISEFTERVNVRAVDRLRALYWSTLRGNFAVTVLETPNLPPFLEMTICCWGPAR